MTYNEVIKMAKRMLADAGVDDINTDVNIIMENVTGKTKAQLLMVGDAMIPNSELSLFKDMVEKRASRVPLQYLLGYQEFMGYRFFVDENVLIPRQDTEILVETVLKYVEPGMKIIDVCTGSGCILISILKKMGKDSGIVGVGTDIMPGAINVAMMNAKSNDVNAVFYKTDLMAGIKAKVDIIVSNPPYINSDVIDTLMPEVKDYEPKRALDGGEDGLKFYRRITKECKPRLKEGGLLAFEIGYDQGLAVKELMENAGFTEVKIIKDYAGCDRVVTGRLYNV